MSIFSTLSEIDVSEHIEQKNGLNYLSWAWAWTEVKKLYPEANYKIYETDTGVIYWHDGKTAWVKTSVTINELEHIEYLPIMDFRNRSIPVDNITSFDVNKAIQRSLTKALARHGLGLYIYAGEDLPESSIKSCEICGKAILPTKTKTIEQICQGTKHKMGKQACVKCFNEWMNSSATKTISG